MGKYPVYGWRSDHAHKRGAHNTCGRDLRTNGDLTPGTTRSGILPLLTERSPHMAIQREHWISIEEYHEIERNSEVKYEYSNGHIYEMSGGTSEHCRIAIHMINALELHLGEQVCIVFSSDMKVLPLGDEKDRKST